MNEGRPPLVSLEQDERAILVEVLPLEDGARVHLADAAHERLDERVVLAAAQTLLRVAEVQRIGEERGVVGADVEADGQALRRMDARARDVEGQLADGDAHAADALIAQPEDAFVVGRHDQADVVVRRVPEDARDVVHVIGRDPEAARAAIDLAELLTRLAHRGRVDDGHQLGDVIDQHAIEQHLVAIVQARHPDVLLERSALGADLTDGGGRLLGERGDAMRDHPAHVELVPLRAIEGGRLIRRGILEQPNSRLPGLDDLRARQIVS